MNFSGRAQTVRSVFSAMTLAIVITVFIGGCSAPFTTDILARAEDATPPVVSITTPTSESFYAKTVVVFGTVTDATDSADVSGEVAALRYEIPAASIQEVVEFDADGAFTFQFSTTSFTGGTISFQVVATDGNGNETVASISLLYGGSDIATFEALPGNQQVSLQWNAVPEATGYTVRNVGEALEVAVGADASSYTWPDLENGELYFFQLEAEDGSGQVNVSSEVSVIPLSPYTLLPQAEPYDDHVCISWRAMPGINRYTVEKAESIDGPYFKRFVTSGTTAEDSLLSRDQYYYYRIYPDEQEEIKSAPVEAVLLPFSVSGTEPGNYFGPLTRTYRAISYGHYLFIDDQDINDDHFIKVLDATDPANLVEVGSVNTGNASFIDIALDETEELLYVSREEVGVQVIDISDPVNPVIAAEGVGSEPLMGGPAFDAFYQLGVMRGASNSYIFGLNYDGYLYSARVDLSGGEVTLVPTQATSPFATDSDAMFILNDTAFVSVKDGGGIGFDTIDVSAPETSLVHATGHRMAETYAPSAIVATADYVFFGYRTGATTASVRAVDATNFATNLVDYDFQDQIQSLSIDGERLYVSAGSDGLQVFDISTPPSAANTNPVIVPDTAGPAHSSVVHGDYLVVAEQIGVESFFLLPAIGYGSEKFTVGAYTSLRDMTSIGNQAHVLSYYTLYTADLSNPETLTSLNPVSGIDGGNYLILQGNRELVGTPDIASFVSAPSSIAPAVEGTFIHATSEIYSIGDVSYGWSGSILSIFDTSDSSAVTHLRSIGFDVSINGLAAKGDYLYASYLFDVSYAPRESGIIVLDISEPVYPQEVYRLPAGADIAFHDMELFGDFIYVVYSDNNGTYHSTPGNSADDESGLWVYSLVDDAEFLSFTGTYIGDDVFTTDDWSWTKRFELVEVRGHLVVLSSGSSASGTGSSSVYEGRMVLLNAADPANITRIKDILPDGGYSYRADFPKHIEFWKGLYLFVMGSEGFTLYAM